MYIFEIWKATLLSAAFEIILRHFTNN